MKFSFQNTDLENLYYMGEGIKDYPAFVGKAFFKKVSMIKNAKNENDIRAIKGNHFEKIKGEDNLYSIRLNDQYRLEFSIEESDCKSILIKKISNHYSKT